MFKFPMQPILEHRQHLEENAQRQVGEALRRVAEIDRDIQECETAGQSANTQWHREMGGGISVGRQELFFAWRQELRRQRGELTACRAEAQEILNEARRDLSLAHRELRKFELMRERALLEYQWSEAKQEQKTLDDQTIMRHGRNFVGRSGRRQEAAR